MSHDTNKLLSLAKQLETLAAEGLTKEAKKDKGSKKLDPKAKVRNKGTVCVPAESAKDKKDHFPINDIDQARNALARVHQYSSVPSWYNGSLKGLQDLVSRKVHSKYPAIGKEKKSKADFNEALINKYSQAVPMATQKADPTAQINQALAPYGYGVVAGSTVEALPNAQYVDVRVQAGPKAKWKGTGNQAAELKKLLDPITMATLGMGSKPMVYS